MLYQVFLFRSSWVYQMSIVLLILGNDGQTPHDVGFKFSPGHHTRGKLLPLSQVLSKWLHLSFVTLFQPATVKNVEEKRYKGSPAGWTHSC